MSTSHESPCVLSDLIFTLHLWLFYGSHDIKWRLSNSKNVVFATEMQ